MKLQNQSQSSIEMNNKQSKLFKQAIDSEKIFNRIGIWYDLVSWLSTWGLINSWRNFGSELLLNRGPLRILDLACGTAEQIISFSAIKVPVISITGLDISERMLQIAQKKTFRLKRQHSIFLLQGDMHSLKFDDSFFDALTFSFGLSCSANIGQVFSEAARVLKPDCPLIITEFNKPNTFATLHPYTFYINFLVPGIGRLISGAKEAYQKIASLINNLPDQNSICLQLKTSGFQKISIYKLFPGFVTLYCAKKRTT